MAVPTIEVMAQNAPPPAKPQAADTLVVALNLKATSVYAGVFRFDVDSNRWTLTRPAALTTLDALLDEVSDHVTLLGDPLPAIDARHDGRYTPLPPELATPRSEHVFTLGQSLARLGRFTPALELSPEYVREPEAKTLWDRKYGA
jgi:tRNA A37 threonylcarbamoyladenosine modification protein TsaB